MRKLRINHNEKGFTLIELMIVIAIIGILSAIAIPNFISYRNKTFCSQAESDAQCVAGAVADYFAIPTHTAINNGDVVIPISGNNTYTVTSTDPNTVITITVTDASGRCPDDYQAASPTSTFSNTQTWNGSNEFLPEVSN